MRTKRARRAYVPRVIDSELQLLAAGLGAVLLEGAKAVGKTASAKRISARTVRLDNPAEAQVVRADPSAAIREPYPVFFDEWQRVPEIFDAIRHRIDDDPTPGLAILAGSAQPPVSARPTHSGAGRIVTLRMRPWTLSERLEADGLAPDDRASVSVRALVEGARPSMSGNSVWRLTDYAREIVASGFPALRDLSAPLRIAQLEGYVDHLVSRDAEEVAGGTSNPALLRRWLTAYAAATATTTSLEKLRAVASAGDGSIPAKTTVLRHRDALERLFIYDPVSAWQPGGTALSRLVEAPKIHLVDPAISAHLLGINEEALLNGSIPSIAAMVPTVRDGGLFGSLFESLVVQSMRTYAQAAGAMHFHLRTRGGGHEVDGILVRRDQRYVAYEVKLGGRVEDKDVRHLRWLKAELGDQLLDAMVINTGPAAYRRSEDGIAVVPAAMLVP